MQGHCGKNSFLMANGTVVLTVSWQIVYWNVLFNGFAFFVGLIRLRSSPLPKLQGLEYILNVTATDDNASGGLHPLSSTARVIVGVDDVNNNKPVFEEVKGLVEGQVWCFMPYKTAALFTFYTHILHILFCE